MQHGDVTKTKAHLRARFRAQRQARTPAERELASRRLDVLIERCEHDVVAAFVPVAGEPGDLHCLDLLARRCRVLLPIVTKATTPLAWGWYDGASSLVRGPFGLLQPAHGDELLSYAEVVVIPAVALSAQGQRLGHGGGYYDRALAGIDRDRIIGLVHDDEVVDELPVEAHDIRVGWVCTPAGIRRAIS